MNPITLAFIRRRSTLRRSVQPISLPVSFRILLAAPFWILLGTGCTSPSHHFISPTPLSSERGNQSGSNLISEKTNRVVVRLLTPGFSAQLAALPAFDVVVSNLGQSPIPFSSADITASVGDRAVRIYDSYDLSAKITAEARMNENAAIWRGNAQSQAAEFGAFNPGSQAPIVAKANALSERVAARSATQKDISVAASLLYPRTILPGTTVGGVIKLHAEDMPSTGQLKLVVHAGSEIHEFSFTIGD